MILGCGNKWSLSVDFYRLHIRSHGISEYIKRKFETECSRFEPWRWPFVSAIQWPETQCPQRKVLAVVQYQKSVAYPSTMAGLKS